MPLKWDNQTDSPAEPSRKVQLGVSIERVNYDWLYREANRERRNLGAQLDVLIDTFRQQLSSEEAT